MGAPFTMFAGEKKVLNFTIADKDQAANPDGSYPPIDLTNFTAIWSLSRKPGARYRSESELFEAMTVLAPATDGRVSVTLDEAQTIDLEGSFHQQVRIFDASNADAPAVVFADDFFIRRTQSDS